MYLLGAKIGENPRSKPFKKSHKVFVLTCGYVLNCGFRVTKNTVFLRCFLLTYFMILQNIGKNSDSVIIPVEKNIIPNTTVIIELTLIFF